MSARRGALAERSILGGALPVRQACARGARHAWGSALGGLQARYAGPEPEQDVLDACILCWAGALPWR